MLTIANNSVLHGMQQNSGWRSWLPSVTMTNPIDWILPIGDYDNEYLQTQVDSEVAPQDIHVNHESVNIQSEPLIPEQMQSVYKGTLPSYMHNSRSQEAASQEFTNGTGNLTEDTSETFVGRPDSLTGEGVDLSPPVAPPINANDTVKIISFTSVEFTPGSKWRMSLPYILGAAVLTAGSSCIYKLVTYMRIQGIYDNQKVLDELISLAATADCSDLKKMYQENVHRITLLDSKERPLLEFYLSKNQKDQFVSTAQDIKTQLKERASKSIWSRLAYGLKHDVRRAKNGWQRARSALSAKFSSVFGIAQ
jgi:hypothetical protein